MRGKRTLVINGQRYDSATGVPVGTPRSAHRPTGRPRTMDVVPARTTAVRQTAPVQSVSTKETVKPRHHIPAAYIHNKPQKSQTLHRGPLQKPTAKHAGEAKRQRAIVAKSPHISKFALQPAEPVRQSAVRHEAPVPQHPTATKAHQRQAAKRAEHPSISSRTIKEHLIKEQLDKADTTRQYSDHTAPKERSKKSRFFSLATASLALLLVGGYLTYLNMPGLSIRVAAARAGINASLPEYHPDGYRFNGPITFSNGQVELSYSANGGPHSYNITQKASDWDSQAVLDSYVLKQTQDYNIHSIQGLTVYTFGEKAVWVDGGILHEVTYDSAPLSYDQIERIAASM